MKVAVALCFVTMAVTSSFGLNCKEKVKCYDDVINEKVNDQIQVELKGHYTYLYLSQIFDQHERHYPNVAKYLRAKSAEEMTHAERFIQYQNQRGGKVTMPSVTRYQEGACATIETITNAMKCAMELEAHVTSALTQLHNDAGTVTISSCSATVADIVDDDLRLAQPLLMTCRTASRSDTKTVSAQGNNCDCNEIDSVAYVELAEMIAHEFLGHQVEDTKEIANHYNTVKKLEEQAEVAKLGEFLFDKHLDL